MRARACVRVCNIVQKKTILHTCKLNIKKKICARVSPHVILYTTKMESFSKLIRFYHRLMCRSHRTQEPPVEGCHNIFLCSQSRRLTMCFPVPLSLQCFLFQTKLNESMVNDVLRTSFYFSLVTEPFLKEVHRDARRAAAHARTIVLPVAFA